MQRQPGGRRPGRLAAPGETPIPPWAPARPFDHTSASSSAPLQARALAAARPICREPDFALSAKQAASIAIAARADPVPTRRARPESARRGRLRRSARTCAAQRRFDASAALVKPREEAPFLFFCPPPPFPHAGVFDCQCQSLCLRSGRLACELKKARYYSRNQLKTMRN